jgi:hypothetical protein
MLKNMLADDHKKMMARIDDLYSKHRNTRKETMACQETTEARLVYTTPEVAHEQEVPMEDAAVMPVGEPRKRRWYRRNLAAGRRQKEE